MIALSPLFPSIENLNTAKLFFRTFNKFSHPLNAQTQFFILKTNFLSTHPFPMNLRTDKISIETIFANRLYTSSYCRWALVRLQVLSRSFPLDLFRAGLSQIMKTFCKPFNTKTYTLMSSSLWFCVSKRL